MPGYEIPTETDDPEEETEYWVDIDRPIVSEHANEATIKYFVSIGADVEWARYAFATSDNYLRVCSQMEQGAGTEIVGNNIKITQEVTETGHYYLIIIADDGQGRWNFTLSDVEYVKSSWQVYGTGTFYFSFFSSNYDGSLEALPGFTLYQSEDDPQSFKIGEWFQGYNFQFTWDQSTNVCVVADQFTGYEHQSYGEIYIMEGKDYADRYSQNTSYYDPSTRTFHFFSAYYVEAGCFGVEEELFELTEDGAVKHLATRSLSKAFMQRHPRFKIHAPLHRELSKKGLWLQEQTTNPENRLQSEIPSNS